MTITCESCGMPIAAGHYCPHCIDADGNLQPFGERFERMVAWAMRNDPAVSRAAAEGNTLAYMAGMPAWRDHPEVKRRMVRS